MTVEFREGSRNSQDPPPVPPSPETRSGTIVMSASHDSDLRRVAELFRDGQQVALDLTGMSDADVQRVIDFSTGLVQGLRGSLQKISDLGLVLTPAAAWEALARDPARAKERALAEEVRTAEYRLAERMRKFGIEVKRGDMSFPIVGPETSIGPETSVSALLRQRLTALQDRVLTGGRLMNPYELAPEIEDVLDLLQELHRETSTGQETDELRYRAERIEQRLMELGERLMELHDVLSEGPWRPGRLENRYRVTREIADVLDGLRRVLHGEVEDRVDRLEDG